MRAHKPIFRWLTGLLLLSMLGVGMLGGAGLSARAAPVSRRSNAIVVISEFRFIGPNGGNDEFIEIHNRTNFPVDISGWGFGGQIIPVVLQVHGTHILASTFLQPGQYYLVTDNICNGAYCGDCS